MEIKHLLDEDFINFKKPSMFIATSKCDFKCDKECGQKVCQNSPLAATPIYHIEDTKLINRYLNNDITEAIVIGGLEPFDTFDEIYLFIKKFRQLCQDTIVIYTGYYPSEIKEKLQKLFDFKQIIIKFGRFIPDNTSRYDEKLGVTLASSNQFALTIEEIEKQLEQ